MPGTAFGRGLVKWKIKRKVLEVVAHRVGELLHMHMGTHCIIGPGRVLLILNDLSSPAYITDIRLEGPLMFRQLHTRRGVLHSYRRRFVSITSHSSIPLAQYHLVHAHALIKHNFGENVHEHPGRLIEIRSMLG